MKISSKILATTDTTKRLSLETRILQHLPPFKAGQSAQVLVVEDEEGKLWRFLLTIRRGRYRKPVLSVGWLQFVRSKRLQRGFKVEFFRQVDETNGEFVYKIKMKRPIIIFNSVLGYAPYQADEVSGVVEARDMLRYRVLENPNVFIGVGWSHLESPAVSSLRRKPILPTQSYFSSLLLPGSEPTQEIGRQSQQARDDRGRLDRLLLAGGGILLCQTFL